MVKKIKFKIDAEGNVELDVEGAQGKECESMTKPFEKALGFTKSTTFKDSYYQEEVQGAEQNNGDNYGN